MSDETREVNDILAALDGDTHAATRAATTGTGGGKLSDLLTGTGNAPAAPVKPPKSDYCVDAHAFDHYLFEQARESMPGIEGVIAEGRETFEYDPADKLAEDVYAALYKPAPELLDAQRLKPEVRRNHRALDEMLRTREYQELHALTELSDFAAGVATQTVTSDLLQKLKDMPPDEPQPGEGDDDENSQGGGSGGQGAGSGGGGGDSSDEGGDDEQDQPQPQQTPSPEQQQQDRQQRQQLRTAARQAIKKARADVDDAQSILDAFGGGDDQLGPGWGTEAGREQYTGSVAARVALAQRALQDRRLRLIAQIAGRMKWIAAEAQRKQVEHGVDEVYDIEMGTNLSRALPSELALLTDPDLEMLFFQRLTEGRLLQYKLRGIEKQGKGPIILLVDESGSMGSQHMGIARNDWASAMGIALLSIAAKQKRDFRWIHFGSSYELLVEDYPQGKGTPEQVMNSALHFFGGGTSYDRPLRSALDAITTSAFNKADIIWVSDDECGISPDVFEEWHRVRKERDTRAYGIMVGRGSAPVLRSACDAVMPVYTPGQDDRDALMGAFSI